MRYFAELDLSFDDMLLPGCVTLVNGHRDSVPVVLKKLHLTELTGYQLISALTVFPQPTHLVPFELFEVSSPSTSPAKELLGPAEQSTVPVASDAGIAPGRTWFRTPIKRVVHGQQPTQKLGRKSWWACMPHYPVCLDHYSTPLTRTAAEQLLIQIFHALDHLHCAGLAHLDVKPSNIFVDMGGILAAFENLETRSSRQLLNFYRSITVRTQRPALSVITGC